jgi:cobalt/nickel transport system permease protein
MHMADALLSAAVGGTMCAVSAASIGFSIAKINKDELCEKKVPIMAVTGAFVFAAQMINFTIPGTGSSGHIGGGILLASLLTGFPALLTISAVLIIQCLFFADGGLLALGCNIFNLGVIPCLFVYPFLFKPVLNRKFTTTGICAASISSVIVSLQLGALGVVLQTHASGAAQLPFRTFALLMQPIHLLIGIFEGIITAAALCFVNKMRPELLESASRGTKIGKTVPLRNIIIALAVITIVTGAVLSVFSSSLPDGLEWAIGKTAGTETMEPPEGIQDTTAFMPGYKFKGGDDSPGGTSVAGIIGGGLTFVLAGGTALIISAVKKKRKRGAPESA